MGAHDFQDSATGSTIQEAYQNAVEQAVWEYGHDPYNGTISTTSGVREIKLPEGVDEGQFISAVWQNYDGRSGGKPQTPDKYTCRDCGAEVEMGTDKLGRETWVHSDPAVENHPWPLPEFEQIEAWLVRDLTDQQYEQARRASTLFSKWENCIGWKIPGTKDKYRFTGMAAS